MSRKKDTPIVIVLTLFTALVFIGSIVLAFMGKDKEPVYEEEPDLVIEQNDYQDIADLINKEIKLTNFFFGDGLECEENFVYFESIKYHKVKENELFKSVNDIKLYAQEIYSDKKKIDFYVDYPRNKVPMFIDYEGSLYVGEKYYNPAIPDWEIKEVTPDQLDVRVENNIYATATIQVEGHDPIVWHMQKMNGVWRINNQLYIAYGNLADNVFKSHEQFSEESEKEEKETEIELTSEELEETSGTIKNSEEP